MSGTKPARRIEEVPLRRFAVYARYSSDSQREASIEDQLRECRKWADAHDALIVEQYCDYAISGRTDDRPQFQRMIADAEKGLFSGVVVYQTSRFCRNRYDAAIYKHRLKKAGVSLHYASMDMPDGPEGIIMEALMEGLDEYYSANLSKNIRRGQDGNALKCIAMVPAPLGLRVNADRHYEPDPATAPHVLRAYQMIDDGRMQKDVLSFFNSLGLKTIRGNPFTKSSLCSFWSNRKYIGEYSYRDVTVPHAFPSIVPEDLFFRVNEIIRRNAHRNGGRSSAMSEFILTGKLICGHCGRPMVGVSGTSRNGSVHYYYACTGVRRRLGCSKANERRTALEKAIVRETLVHVLKPDVVTALVDRCMEIQSRDQKSDPVLNSLLSEQKTVNTSLQNLLRAIEDGLYTPTTKRRMEELEHQQADVSSRIALHQSSVITLSREQILFFLRSFIGGDVSDPVYRERVISALVQSVTVTDVPPSDDDPTPRRHVKIVYNLTDNPSSTFTFSSDCGSTTVCYAPPNQTETNRLNLYPQMGVLVLEVVIMVPE